MDIVCFLGEALVSHANRRRYPASSSVPKCWPQVPRCPRCIYCEEDFTKAHRDDRYRGRPWKSCVMEVMRHEGGGLDEAELWKRRGRTMLAEMCASGAVRDERRPLSQNEVLGARNSSNVRACGEPRALRRRTELLPGRRAQQRQRNRTSSRPRNFMPRLLNHSNKGLSYPHRRGCRCPARR